MFQRALPAGRGEETTDTVGKEIDILWRHKRLVYDNRAIL